MRRALTFAVAATTALTLVAGCESDKSPNSAAPSPSIPEQSAPDPSPTKAPTEAPPTAPATAPTKAVKPKLKAGAKGPEVLALQQRLTDLGYWIGKPDGKFGSTTKQAVYALQKSARLDRDGVVGPATRQALDRGVRPKARSQQGHVIEISLRRQVLMIVDDGQVKQIFNTSTGSNENYVHEGETYLADTPAGRFRVGRQIDGWRHGPLGPLWRPKYFNGGIAVHGAPSVPAYPASHGCARLSIAAMNWIWANDRMPLKTRVWVYK
jgi:peptidoglycan hydrolase-like protein with peptidoglycan-binding domain